IPLRIAHGPRDTQAVLQFDADGLAAIEMFAKFDPGRLLSQDRLSSSRRRYSHYQCTKSSHLSPPIRRTQGRYNQLRDDSSKWLSRMTAIEISKPCGPVVLAAADRQMPAT